MANRTARRDKRQVENFKATKAELDKLKNDYKDLKARAEAQVVKLTEQLKEVADAAGQAEASRLLAETVKADREVEAG